MAKAKAASETTTEVAVSDLAGMDTLDLINKGAVGIDFIPETWEELAEAFDGELIQFQGSPWKVTDKADLVGVPFVIADIRAYEGKFGDAIAVMALVKGEDDKPQRVVFNDGSSGVMAQVIHMVRSTGKKSGILCEGGLRVSEYDYEPKDLDGVSLVGKPKPEGGVYEKTPAATYYVA